MRTAPNPPLPTVDPCFMPHGLGTVQTGFAAAGTTTTTTWARPV